MKYNELNMTSQKSPTRVGRGIAAGKGKTAGRGTKGQNARKSGGVRPGFEGGQNPLMQRLPKMRGFRAVKPQAETVYTGQLNDFKGVVDNFKLFEAGLVSTPYGRVKVVLNGELSAKVDVKLQGASQTAQAAIKKAGGNFTVVSQPKRTKKDSSKAKK
jgi:large subunit ribosomal protein L15